MSISKGLSGRSLRSCGSLVLMAGFVFGAALSLGPSSARADASIVSTCGGGWGFRSCSMTIRKLEAQQDSIEARREAAAREAQWEARCKPAISYDAFGMARYSYAAEGCEFGRPR